MALNYRRGSASIEEAATKKSGGGFRPFIPQINWREDGDSKYVLVLTDIEDVAELLLHTFVPVGKGEKSNGEEFTRYEDFLSRKMPAIGEDYDDLEDRLEREPKVRHMGVMVELEPVVDPGTKKMTSFVVKTETFTRKTDDGEVEVTAPVIGLCTQSAQLMWGPLNNLYRQLGSLIDTPLSVTRHGVKTNTRYDMIPFMEKPVDLSPVIEYLDGINFIGEEELPDVVKAIEAAETDQGQAQVVADFLLNKRIDELADAERYEELVGPLTLEDMPKNNWGRKQTKSAATRPARPARRSPRNTASETPEASEVEDTPKPAKNERFAALKSRVEARG